MKVFRISYFADEYQQEAIVAAADEKKAEKMVSKNCEFFDLISSKECDITSENIIHHEVIEMM